MIENIKNHEKKTLKDKRAEASKTNSKTNKKQNKKEKKKNKKMKQAIKKKKIVTKFPWCSQLSDCIQVRAQICAA